MRAHAPRIVVDTNVLLDFWVFDDPHARPLKEALEAGRVLAVRSRATDLEFDDVLARPQFGLDAAARMTLQARWRAGAESIGTIAPAPLQCTDRDDQKFLDLAFSAGARALATKDRALLAAARHARAHGLLVGGPAALVSALFENQVS